MTAPKKRKRVIVLDTHAIIHRAYHALPDFATSKGEPTGALYGLVAMLLKSVEELKPDAIVACRDLPGATHRHESFDAYKATRKEADDALVVQLEAAPEVFAAFGIPLYEAPGYEADDCIGTLVEKFKNGYDVIIVSGDMDTLQLVDDHVRVYTLRKGLNDTILYDGDRVRERYGFGPEHVIDYKALRGDPSDNIPGIRGIGEKTAVGLVTEIGSLDDIYALLERSPETLIEIGIKKRVIELLRNGKNDAAFSKELATIRRDVPLVIADPQPWALGTHAEAIVALCDRYEFRSLRERVKTILTKRSKGESAHASLFAAEESEDDADPVLLKETSLALWLLRSDMATPTLGDILTYAHARDLASAAKAIFAELENTGRLVDVYERIEKPLIPIVERMHDDGIKVDTAFLRTLAKEYAAELDAIAGRIYGHAGHEFNISSPKQLGDVLYDELRLVPEKQKKTAGGARTTREEELAKLAGVHPIIGEVLQYRELQKLLSTYIEKIIDLVSGDGRLHAQFLQSGTTTGRMSSQNPNLQNIPIRTEYGRRVRSAFTAEKGFMLAAIDYSQIELRIAAGLSGDERLVRVFKEGGDIHTAVASSVFGVEMSHVDKEMRRRAKVINFGILYGMGVNALRANLGEGVSREEAAAFLEGYFASYPQLTRFLDDTKASAAQRGYTETLFGRRRYFSGFKSTLPGLRAQAERMAVNAPIQGTQADIIKLAMVAVDGFIEREGLRDDVRLLLQVHDELVYEIREGHAEATAQRIKAIMESVAPRDRLSGVPIVAEASVGERWGDMRRLSA